MSESGDLLSTLNAEQQEAVMQTEGYICLHAGAGTGKTRTLTHRYAYLIRDFGIAPRAVWAVTFTNKAANEMSARVRQLCGDLVGNPFITTFHGFCARFLREEIAVLGWPATFVINDVDDVKAMLRTILKTLKIDGRDLTLPQAWAAIDTIKSNSDYVQDLIAADSSALLDRSEAAAEISSRVFWRYLFSQRTTFTLDFDDLILFTLYILRRYPEVLARWQKRFDYILVDEFQDIDKYQYELVELLAAGQGNLFVVGDPDQTIYSFRGARVEFFNDFVANHSEQGNEAQRLFLTKNYRSTDPILKAAYHVISHNLDEARRPLQAMRTDISPADMITVQDPRFRRKRDAAQVRAAITAQSYYHDAPVSAPSSSTVPVGTIGSTVSAATSTTFGGATGPSGSMALSGAGQAWSGQTGAGAATLNATTAAQQAVANLDAEAAAALAAGADMRPVVLHTGSIYHEAELVTDCIMRLQQQVHGSIAVLYRANHQAAILETELNKAGIRYVVSGDVRFFDRKEIRDVLAYIRLRLNLDDDMAFRRVINVPPRRFGAKRIEHLEALAKQERCSLFAALQHHRDDSFLFQRTTVGDFVDLMSSLHATPLQDPLYDLELLLNGSGYEEFIKSSGESERLENIATLKNQLAFFLQSQDDSVNLADFLNNIVLINGDEERNASAGAVRLMTIHNAKGLEFDYVFVLGLNEGVFPTKKAINEQSVSEERRLMYVAMTRAQKQLFLSEAGGITNGANNDSAGKQKQARVPSRFLFELEEGDYLEVGTCALSGQSIAQIKAQQQRLQCDIADLLAQMQESGGRALLNENVFAGSDLDKDKESGQKSSKWQVGDRVFHKILGAGTVRELHEDVGEIVVHFDKLKRERTLALHVQLEPCTAPAPNGAPAALNAPDPMAMAAIAAANAAVPVVPVSAPQPVQAPQSTEPATQPTEPHAAAPLSWEALKRQILGPKRGMDDAERK